MRYDVMTYNVMTYDMMAYESGALMSNDECGAIAQFLIMGPWRHTQ